MKVDSNEKYELIEIMYEKCKSKSKYHKIRISIKNLC